MAEYLIQDTTLTDLADEIRILSGTEGTMTPAVMNSNLVVANTELDNQDVLIEQLKAALEGKASGGITPSENLDSELVEQDAKIAELQNILTSKAANNIDTCTVSLRFSMEGDASMGPSRFHYFSVVDGKQQYFSNDHLKYANTIVKNSLIFISVNFDMSMAYGKSSVSLADVTGDIEMIYNTITDVGNTGCIALRVGSDCAATIAYKYTS